MEREKQCEKKGRKRRTARRSEQARFTTHTLRYPYNDSDADCHVGATVRMCETAKGIMVRVCEKNRTLGMRG